MNHPLYHHYGLRNGQGSASEVLTGQAEFGKRGDQCYWRGQPVPPELWASLQELDTDLRQSIFDAHMKALSLSEHDAGGAA